jgi:hypothetical protein
MHTNTNMEIYFQNTKRALEQFSLKPYFKIIQNFYSEILTVYFNFFFLVMILNVAEP